ncbi:MAG: DUF3791 domain-containing protein [Peptococcaceae bacterium]|jgi:hypothetical protein|nr:DUF3791 domain-containing protein [Peptococcaceae bacterium]
MPYANLDDKTYLQVQIANLYIRKHGITPQEFVKLDDECDVLGFLRDGYEMFHLTGEQGVLCEVEDYIALNPHDGGSN